MSESKAQSSTDSSADELSFEDAFERLEMVVNEMETEQVPLESLIENYEAGTRWYEICQKRLEEAQGRIEMIRKKADGKVEVEPFDPESAAEEVEISESNPAKTANPSLKEDGQLF